MNNALRAVLSHAPAISAGERAILASVTLATMIAPPNSTMIAPHSAADRGRVQRGRGWRGLAGEGLELS